MLPSSSGHGERKEESQVGSLPQTHTTTYSGHHKLKQQRNSSRETINHTHPFPHKDVSQQSRYLIANFDTLNLLTNKWMGIVIDFLQFVNHLFLW